MYSVCLLEFFRIMILTVNIGNTNISLGRFQGDKLISHNYINKGSLTRQDVNIPLSIGNIKDIQAIVIASVNPVSEAAFCKYLEKQYTKKIFKIGREIPLKMPILVERPEKVGVDRLLNALAAYDLTRTATIVVDFGTALTIDIVSKCGEFIGGLIMPGIETSAYALKYRTAFLPKVEIRKPDKMIGKDTESAIASGIYYGTVGAVLYILEGIRKEVYDAECTIATGGDAEKFAADLPQINEVVPLLTLEGIKIAFEDSCGGS
ncbi:MAG: type III pantothenate kinase [Planctomycetes bacterium]|nr:type III pantothenate kinase [Planctomycetota bacterium]